MNDQQTTTKPADLIPRGMFKREYARAEITTALGETFIGDWYREGYTVAPAAHWVDEDQIVSVKPIVVADPTTHVVLPVEAVQNLLLMADSMDPCGDEDLIEALRLATEGVIAAGGEVS
ncbi:hypothetical protein [Aeromicrobium sp. 179-A 4D2 NHS]|uniref:hypothetical protein n=1 Tax=Aeromicrobium sp. 179-A 4D2 NHS TaxID=3142375 RepID=UPI0039A35FB1